MTISRYQQEHDEWVRKNFPMSIGKPEDALLGLVEEVGELAHASLKQRQNIRGTFEQHEADMRDAVGDIFVYLCSYCNAKGWSLAQIVEDVWSAVKQRDWTKNAVDGKVGADAGQA